jgi:aspartate racemase
MKTKTIGILGGVGPETTSHVYHSIINAFRKSGQKIYPSILVYNLPFPFMIENEVIIEGKNAEKMIPYLLNGAKILEKGGADFGILPCNTLHKYINQIRESVKIPFLSIIDEVALKLRLMKIESVGILATETTVRDRLYDDIFKKNGINILYPPRIEQDRINKIIVELLNNRKNLSQEKEIETICSSLHKKGARAVLLACTDLQILSSNIHIVIPVIDTTDVLIKASVRELKAK